MKVANIIYEIEKDKDFNATWNELLKSRMLETTSLKTICAAFFLEGADYMYNKTDAQKYKEYMKIH